MLRNYIRSLLFEALAIDSKIFAKKLNEFAKQDPLIKNKQLQSIYATASKHNVVMIGGSLNPYPRKDSPPKDKKSFISWVRQPRQEIDWDYVKQWKVDVKSHLKARYSKFAKARGWNLLRISMTPPMAGPTLIYALEIDFDQTPHIEVSGIISKASEIKDEYFLYHMTNSSIIEKITSSGFKPSKKSSDGKFFGNGRSYFVIIPKETPESIINQFFTSMSKKRGFAGIGGQQSYMKLDLNKIQPNIKFYKDTEWSGGSGKIPVRKIDIEAIAVYTPSFIKADSIIEVIKL